MPQVPKVRKAVSARASPFREACGDCANTPPTIDGPMSDAVHAFVLRLETGLQFKVATTLRDMAHGELRFNRPPTIEEAKEVATRIPTWRADSMQTVADITGEAVEDMVLQPDGSCRLVTYRPRPPVG